MVVMVNMKSATQILMKSLHQQCPVLQCIYIIATIPIVDIITTDTVKNVGDDIGKIKNKG